MKLPKLYELIRFLQKGTRLHVGTVLFSDLGGDAFRLPHGHTIHDSPVCWFFKEKRNGTQRCFRCRQAALRKAQREGKGFGGLCINGVYEYTHPVMMNGNCVAVIYVGNVFLPEGDHRRLFTALGEDRTLADTMEQNTSEEDCRQMALIIEGYLRTLWAQEEETGNESADALIENVKSYLRANLESPLRLRDVARLFHYNEQYLGRRFRRETGLTFSQYLNEERLTRAAKLLESTAAPVIEIAARTGFPNVTYFNRLFRPRFGCTPSEYRSQGQ